MKIMEDSHCEWKPTTKENEWDTKEGTDKSMKNAFMYSGMAKGISQAEAMLEQQKIKLLACRAMPKPSVS